MKPYQRSIFFRTNRLFVAATLGTLAASPLAQAGTFTWTQNSVATQTWTTPTNWASSNVYVSDAANELKFFSDITTALINGTNSITGSVPTTLSMNILTLNGKGADATANSTINIANSSSTWTLDGTTPTVNLNGVKGTVSPARLLNYNVAAKLSLAQTNTLFTGNGTAGFTFSGVISGTSASNGITKSGTSTLTLTNTSNSFSGDVMVNTGILDAHRGSLGTTAGKTYVNSTGSITTGGQLSLNTNGAPYNEAEKVVIQGPGESAGNTAAALILRGWDGAGLNINGSITLDNTATYRIRTFGTGVNSKDGVVSINGGITRNGAHTGTLILEAYDFYAYANAFKSTTIVNSAIQNNGGDVTVVGNDSSILILQADGNNIGTFTINYNNRDKAVVKLGINDALKTNQNLTLTRGTFDLAGFDQTVNALSGAATNSLITNSGSADSKLTIGNGGGGATFAGVIQNGATHKTALEKTGNGTATLTGANTYAGATTITGGTLAISGAGTIANSPTIIVGASTTFNVSAVTGGYTLGAGQTLSGTGTVSGAMTVAGTLSPGNSPGSITTGNQTWVDGGDYNFQMVDATGVAGTGFDQTVVTGTLNLSSLTAGGFNINLWSLSSIGPDVNGNALNFNSALTQSWIILTTTVGITGFDAADFVINVGANNGTAGFSNALGGGSFSLGTASNSLVLNFTAVPEPGAALFGGLGLLALLRRRR